MMTQLLLMLGIVLFVAFAPFSPWFALGIIWIVVGLTVYVLDSVEKYVLDSVEKK